MNRKTCKGCVHHRPLGDNRHEKYCNYIIDTGEPRGCPAEKCTRYTNGHDSRNNDNEEEQEMPKGKKTSPEKIAEIRDLRAQGQTLREIADNTGIPYKTVQGHCSKMSQKEKEPEISEDTAGKNIANEISPISSITENPEVVKREFSGAKKVLAEYIKSTRRQLDEVRKDYLALGGDPNDIS